MNITALGIDLSKKVFQLHGVDIDGKCILKKTLNRSQLLTTIVNMPKCRIFMEASGGVNYWARKFKEMGHDVGVIAPKFVKPFVKSNKNDAADAEAIVEAGLRPSMRFVGVKELWQQEIQTMHTCRSRLLNERISLGNAIMALFLEYGIAIPKGVRHFLRNVHSALDTHSESIPFYAKKSILALIEHWNSTQKQILEIEKDIEKFSKANDNCKRLQRIEGVGVWSSTAVVAIIGDPKQFKNGRQFAAFLGLVPKQNSSGGKEKLLGISKRGSVYVRTLLVNGARAALRVAHTKDTKQSKWALEKLEKRGNNRASVALANKNARHMWSMLMKGDEYKMAA